MEEMERDRGCEWYHIGVTIQRARRHQMKGPPRERPNAWGLVLSLRVTYVKALSARCVTVLVGVIEGHCWRYSKQASPTRR